METRACERSGVFGVIAVCCLVLLAGLISGCGGESREDVTFESRGGEDRTIPNYVSDPLQAYREQDPHKQAVTGVRYIAMGMMLFQMHVGRLPTEEEGIAAMLEEPQAIRGTYQWRGPYNDEEVVKQDPWGHPYQYRIDPSLELGFEVWSFGPDGRSGNDDILASQEANLPNFAKMAEGGLVDRFGEDVTEQRGVAPEPVPGVVNQPE